MLQQQKPEDLVIATGKTYTVREFKELSFKEVGIELYWKGYGVDEKGIDKKTGKVLVEINPKYFRPAEVELLCGDPSKAKEVLNWEPKTTIYELIKKMIKYDLENDNYGGQE
jgi:GDPmannose 4,6-dehydratase